MRPWRPFFVILLLGILAMRCHLAWGQLPTTELRVLWPPGGTIGEATEVAVQHGENLDEIESLWFSHPKIQATLLSGDPLSSDDSPPTRLRQFNVEIPSEVPEGVYEVRAVGRFGISNPRRFFVSRLPMRIAGEERSTAEGAVPLEIGHGVHAHCNPRQIDHYRLTLEADQSVRIDCRASAIDSQLAASLVLRDPSGKEVLHCRGSADSDPHLVWRAPSAGEYQIEVYDFLYRGGPEFFYQLQVTRREENEASPSAPSRTGTGIGYLFSDSSSTPPATGVVPEGDPLTARVQEILGNAWEELPRTEATDAEVQPLAVPAIISGAFADKTSPVAFEFDAAAGEEFSIHVWSAAVGAATDAQLLVERVHSQEEGSPRMERLVEVDDVPWLDGTLLRRQGKDPHTRFTAPEEGRYRIVLRDLQESSGPEWDKRYWMSVAPPKPDFHLIAYQPHGSADPARSQPTGTCLRRGERSPIDVAVVARDGWQWPVEVRVEGLPEGVTCAPLQLDAGQGRGTLLLEASESAARWTGPIRVVGRVEMPPQTLEKEARYATMVRPDPRGQGAPPMRASDALMLHVTDLETAPLRVQLAGEAAEWTGKRGESVEVPLRIERGEDAKGKITLRAVGLPDDVRADEVNVEGDAAEATVVLQMGGNSPLGAFTFYVSAETQLPWPRNPEALVRAESRLAELETQAQEAEAGEADDAEALQQTIAQARERVEQLRESTKPRDTTVFAPSLAGRLRIDS